MIKNNLFLVATFIVFSCNKENKPLLKTISSEVLSLDLNTESFTSILSPHQNKTATQNEEKLYSFSRDLNGDGINDKIILYKNHKGTDEFITTHFSLPMKIFKGRKDGLDLWHQNGNLITNNQNTCVSEGFETVIIKGNYFTIQQQTCYDYNIVLNAYISFVVKNDNIYLHKYGETYFDKVNHERKIPDRIWTTKDFGKITFDKVTTDFLQKLRTK
ncbi:hypothetical protein [Chryseobacterium sp.]|uniref:hypothetical protein n=1 Tax=Chryseobacterium sp. TaxID=1871047 RepID=UPI00289C97C9|nr:hypothetical protein [Chryseobacterium sp.]